MLYSPLHKINCMEFIKLHYENNKINNDEFEEYFKQLDIQFKQLDIQLANIEKLGSSLLVIGYFFFIHGSNLDILEILDINNTGETSTSVTLLGAEFILVGYIFLFIESTNRLEERRFQKEVLSQDIDLSPYENLYHAYLFSILINIIRVHALSEIDKTSQTGEVFV